MKLNNILLVYMQKNHGALAKIKSVLDKYNINYKEVIREKIKTSDYNKKDLVIVVGGDGTFLRAALALKNHVPFLGVNAKHNKKEGFFMITNKINFESNLKKIINSKYKIIKLTRLQAKINNKVINDLALNEFYIGCKKPYDVFRYWLKINSKKELQKSSGVLVSTAAGSSAWHKSAGGKKIHPHSKDIQFVVREPYHGNIICNYKLLKGTVKNEITIIPEIKDCIIVADSTSKEYRLKKYCKVRISASDKPLKFVYF